MGISAPAFDTDVQAEYVIDADFHVEPTVDDLLPYIENAQIRERLQQHGFPNTGSILEPAVATDYRDTNRKASRALGQARDGEDVRQASDAIGVDMAIVTFGKNRLAGSQIPVVKTAICRAFNDYVLEEVTTVDDEVKAMAVIPQWDIQASVEELERIGREEDIVAAYGWIGPHEVFGQPHFDPVYDLLTDLDLPLVLHHNAETNRFVPQGMSIRTFVEATWVNPCTQAILNTANMVMTGVFDKYPDLNVVYQEAGTNWLPFLAYRLDETYKDYSGDVRFAERLFENDQEYLARKPSEYVFENFFSCSQIFCKPDSPSETEKLLDLIRAGDTLIYSSDFPHQTFDPPAWMSSVLDDDVREEVMHLNAREVFRL